MTKLNELARLGQSVWYGYIRRAFITSGDLQVLIKQGGVQKKSFSLSYLRSGSVGYWFNFNFYGLKLNWIVNIIITISFNSLYGKLHS